MASRRLRAETARFQSSDVPFGIIAGPKNNDMLEWEAQLTGPSESPYANGTFNVKLELSAEYPFKPPKVKFLTKIYHPNIDNEGNICITLLKSDTWKPSINILDSIVYYYLLSFERNYFASKISKR